MIPPGYANSLSADERLGEVAQILAMGALRARLRELRSRRKASKLRDNPLELSAPSSAHALERSRDGER